MADVISKRSITYDITFNTSGAKKGAADAGKAMDGLSKKADAVGGSFANLGKQIAGAFAAQEAVRAFAQFGKEAISLGLKAEGVRKAFNALNDANLLENLRRATRGTVDDLTLMQAAVRADKFRIPLSTLAQLFNFARQRAKETGQEVNYLVDSIIDGIGRKSPMILDNLGLRAQDLQDEFRKTGDFAKAAANVISQEMQASGEDTLSNAEKVAKLAAEWQNVKLEFGEFVVDSIPWWESLGNSIANTVADIVPFLGALRTGTQALDAVRERQEQHNQAVQAGAAIYSRYFNTALNTTEFSLKEIQDRLGDLNNEFAETTDPNKRIELAAQILKFQEMEAAIKKLLDPARKLKEVFAGITPLTKIEPGQIKTGDPQPQFETLDRLNEKLEEFTEKRNKAFTGSEDFQTFTNEIDRIQARISELTETTATIEAIGMSFSDFASTAGSAFSSLAGLAKEGSAQQIILAEASILASSAAAIASAIEGATKSGATTPAAIFTTPAFIATLVSTVLTALGQTKALINQAKATQAQAGGSGAVNVSAFASGEVDIHRPGEQRGKDSIPALLKPGESVLTDDKTRKYRPFVDAIHEGTLEELIRVNYVEPALVMQSLNNSKADSTSPPDYTDKFYRQYLATGEGNTHNKNAVGLLRQIASSLRNRYPSKYE